MHRYFVENECERRKNDIKKEKTKTEKDFNNLFSLTQKLAIAINECSIDNMDEDLKKSTQTNLSSFYSALEENYDTYNATKNSKLSMKHLKQSNSTGIFTAMGLIGCMENRVDPFDNWNLFKTIVGNNRLTVNDNDTSSKNKFRDSLFKTLKGNTFLKFKVDNKLIRKFSSLLMDMTIDELDITLEQISRKCLNLPSRFELKGTTSDSKEELNTRRKLSKDDLEILEILEGFDSNNIISKNNKNIFRNGEKVGEIEIDYLMNEQTNKKTNRHSNLILFEVREDGIYNGEDRFIFKWW